MPLDVSKLSAYPAQQDEQVAAYQEARRALWARHAELLAQEDIEGAKAVLVELRQQAEDRYRAMGYGGVATNG